MNRILPTLLLILLAGLAASQVSKKTQAFADDLCRIVKDHSIYAAQINWGQLHTEIKSLLKLADSTGDLGMLTAHVMVRLREQGDNHSFIESKSSYQKSAVSNTDPRRPYGKLLQNNLGYVYVPGFASLSDTACHSFAEWIQNIIRDLDSTNAISAVG